VEDAPEVVRLEIEGTVHEFRVIVGSQGEKAIDISSLRDSTGYITLDDSYANTGSCQSGITYIDGEKGILRYRGYPIEKLAAEKTSFVETAWLVMFGSLPDTAERQWFTELLMENAALHHDMDQHFYAFPANGHPMAILSSMINALSTHSRPRVHDRESYIIAAARLMAKVRTIAAAAYKSSIGEPLIYPRSDLKYVANLLHMMFSVPYKNYEASKEVSRALNLFFMLHADHEQNCSTSTVRMVASSQANMYTACSAGVAALWGPLHGGANVAVVQMLSDIRKNDLSVGDYIKKEKNKEDGVKLMGFGHRVYKQFDPRAKILKGAADQLLTSMHITDPTLDIARELEQAALADDYFIERKLYPNVDFYSGVILRAVGIPLNMFTVMFSIGRVPGWIANWKEVHDNPAQRIYRPRQIYTGAVEQQWLPRNDRPPSLPDMWD